METEKTVVRSEDLAIADQCRLNVLWLHGAAPGARALEISVDGLRLADGLRSLFREVECIAWPDDERAARSVRLPFADASFELVTLYGRAPSMELLQEAFRLLQPGGTALVAIPNQRWRAGLRSPTGSAAGSAIVERARAAGFRDVRPYWVEPSLAIPRELIPARSDRVRAFEAARARETGRQRVRSVFVATGLHRMLYPARLLVAKA